MAHRVPGTLHHGIRGEGGCLPGGQGPPFINHLNALHSGHFVHEDGDEPVRGTTTTLLLFIAFCPASLKATMLRGLLRDAAAVHHGAPVVLIFLCQPRASAACGVLQTSDQRPRFLQQRPFRGRARHPRGRNTKTEFKNAFPHFPARFLQRHCIYHTRGNCSRTFRVVQRAKPQRSHPASHASRKKYCSCETICGDVLIACSSLEPFY